MSLSLLCLFFSCAVVRVQVMYCNLSVWVLSILTITPTKPSVFFFPLRDNQFTLIHARKQMLLVKCDMTVDVLKEMYIIFIHVR